jgi:chorismate--pyruvate lyase
VRIATLRQALWHRHVNAVNAPAAMVPWLTTGGSLTARLVAHSAAFRVQRLHQRTARCLADEARAIGLPRPGRVWEREVLLRCDEVPVVFAHTVVPMAATANDWPLFNALGERSLGSTLFYDPRVARGALEFARIRAGHPLMRRAQAALGGEHTILYARRCLYRRRQGTLLVTEVFLPSVLELAARTHANTQ